MKAEKFTHKLQEALSEAQSLAISKSHTMLEPVHVLKALLDQEGGMIASIITQAGGNLSALKTELNSTLNNLARSTAVSQIGASNNLIKILQQMEKLSLEKMDEFISSDLFLIAGFTDGAVSRIFKAANLTKELLEGAVDKVRGGARVESQNAEDVQGDWAR
jgi:ATP-dependent Clp protease ATP-binding subunit ClpB